MKKSIIFIYMIKLKSLLPEWVSHGIAVNRNPDVTLHPTPGGMNDNSQNWDGVVEGKIMSGGVIPVEMIGIKNNLIQKFTSTKMKNLIKFGLK